MFSWIILVVEKVLIESISLIVLYENRFLFFLEQSLASIC